MNTMLDDDDVPVGRVLSRREAVRLVALTGGGLLVGCRAGASDGQVAATDSSAGTLVGGGGARAALPACVAKPELTVGPYFVDKQLNRSDIRVEPTTNRQKEGAPLTLTFNVQQINASRCAPLAGA